MQNFKITLDILSRSIENSGLPEYMIGQSLHMAGEVMEVIKDFHTQRDAIQANPKLSAVGKQEAVSIAADESVETIENFRLTKNFSKLIRQQKGKLAEPVIAVEDQLLDYFRMVELQERVSEIGIEEFIETWGGKLFAGEFPELTRALLSYPDPFNPLPEYVLDRLRETRAGQIDSDAFDTIKELEDGQSRLDGIYTEAIRSLDGFRQDD